jgi:uncharacterized protein Yka (UPF0111/DUF47 family)
VPQRVYAKHVHRTTQEAAPVERTEQEQRQDQEKIEATRAEVAELERTSDEIVNKIDEILAFNAGYVAIQAF